MRSTQSRGARESNQNVARHARRFLTLHRGGHSSFCAQGVDGVAGLLDQKTSHLNYNFISIQLAA